MKYTPLHVHSHYSLLDGLAKIDDLIAKAKADGMTALALTDHGVMYGAIEFYQKCKAAGIKPIIGVEAYIVEKRKQKNIADEKRYHLILLAKDIQGYRNLIKLTSKAHLEGYYYKPRIDWEILQQHSEGLIGLSACLAGEVSKTILSGATDEKIVKTISKYQAVFGKDNFYLEVQHHPSIPEQKKVNEKIFDIAKDQGLKVVATNDTHYVNTEDAEAHDILICLQTKKSITDQNRMSYMGEDFSLYSSAQMADNFRGHPEVLENSNEVASKCDLEIPLGEIQLPYFEVPEGMSDFEYFKKMCYDNVKRRYGFDYPKDELNEYEQKVITRLEYEIGVIEKTGYASYFLITQDLINWAVEQGIVVGPGRGSAAGSVVSYLLNITNLDPLKYDLLFERFLNPERISMPDIDTDFADERREEVLRYVEEKYGKDHVAQIITFGTLAARAAVKDVGRVLEMPYSFCDQISKLIPMGMKLPEVIEQVSEVGDLYRTNDEAKRLLDFAMKLEGVARHASTHACGVVITKKPLNHYCPAQYARDQEEAIISQYSLKPVEDLGLLKMDFLGLKNLTIIERAGGIIKAIHDKVVNVQDISLDDQTAYKLFQDGKTTGVFQFESSGMKRYLRMLKPTVFEDLIAMVALYRPGPLNSGMVDEFIDRKHGRKDITYLHPVMEASLKNTYGVIVYQEQVMQLAKDMAGFTGGQADTLRKAMGKKIAALMEKMRIDFLAGCEKNNISKEIAVETFTSMEKFAEYGFNKSHAACYALIAYQTAYLKANYPAEFMASLLTSDQNNMDRIAIEIDECKQMEMEILAPDVNESFSTFAVVAQSLKEGTPKIRFGMSAIRNVGEGVSDLIIQSRKKEGNFQSLEDFVDRVGGQSLNKKSLEGLIKSGALDAFADRMALLESVDKLVLFIKENEARKNTKQVDLFSSVGDGEMLKPKLLLREAGEINMAQILSWEKEFLGLYLSEHPFSPFRKKLDGVITPLIDLDPQESAKKKVKIAGVVSTVKKIHTKSGDPMLFVTVEDSLRSIEILVFPRLYKTVGEKVIEGQVVIVQGTVSDKDDEVKILSNHIWPITESNLGTVLQEVDNLGKLGQDGNGENGQVSRKKPQIMIEYPVGATRNFAERIKMLFMAIPGRYQVIFKVKDKLIKTNFCVGLSSENRKQLEALLGPGSIKRL